MKEMSKITSYLCISYITQKILLKQENAGGTSLTKHLVYVRKKVFSNAQCTKCTDIKSAFTPAFLKNSLDLKSILLFPVPSSER